MRRRPHRLSQKRSNIDRNDLVRRRKAKQVATIADILDDGDTGNLLSSDNGGCGEDQNATASRRAAGRVDYSAPCTVIARRKSTLQRTRGRGPTNQVRAAVLRDADDS